MPCAREIELPERLPHVRERGAHNIRDSLRCRRHPEDHGEDGRHKDADEDRAVHVARHQRRREKQSEEREQRRRCGDVPKGDIGRRILDDQPRPLQSDERDKESDAHADGVFQITWNSIDDCLSDSADCQNQEEHTREEHGTECHGPVQSENAADIVGKERIQPHARCERDGIVRKNAHCERRECGNPNRRGNRRLLRDAGIRKYVWIDEENIRHGNERRHARE